MASLTASTLRLIPPAGSSMAAIELGPRDQPAVIGRSSRCRISLRAPSGESEDLLLSREHAVIEQRGGRWLVRDLSRHGTWLNGVRLGTGSPAALGSRDQLRVGSWTFEVMIGGDAGSGGTSIATVDRSADASRIRRVHREQIGNLAQHRLDLLLRCAEQTAALSDDAALPPLILAAALDGTGLARAALLHAGPQADQITVVAERHCGREIAISRSLVRAALEGDVAILTAETSAEYGVSVIELGIQQALCAPIVIDGVVDWLLYLDSRSGERPAEPDAAAFCHGICRIAGLVRGNLQRQKMRRERQVIEQELQSAQVIQNHLLAPPEGDLSGFRYAVRLQPGRQIAGDLFDVIPISESSVAVCLGDVTGGGAGPGLVMAVTLAHLRAALAASDDIAQAVLSLNRYLCERTPANVFVSLWIATLDSRSGTCRYLDAGHGHWIHWRDGTALPARREHSTMPLGIDETAAYVSTEIPFKRGDRMILYSDGVSECHRRDDGVLDLFGRARVEAALAGSASPRQDVERVFASILAFCGEQGLADDTTAASIDYRP